MERRYVITEQWLLDEYNFKADEVFKIVDIDIETNLIQLQSTTEKDWTTEYYETWAYPYQFKQIN